MDISPDNRSSDRGAPHYAWICQYCEHSSPGGTLHCASCGFPAHTSAFELERAKQLGSVQVFLAEQHAWRDRWRRKPLWKKVLVVTAVPLFGVDLFLLPFAWNWRDMALVAVILGVALLFIRLGR